MSLLALALITIIVIVGLVATAALLANPRTRTIAAIFLTIGLAVLVVGAPAVYLLLAGHTAQTQRQRAQAEQMETLRAQAEARRVLAESPKEPAAPIVDEATPADTAAPTTAPEWLGMAPRQVGDVYRMAVKTDPRATLEECKSELPGLVDAAIDEYARTKLGQPERIARAVELPWSDARQLVKEQWVEPVATSFGEWTELHVLLEFDKTAKGLIERQCDEAVVLGRLGYVGTGLAAVLALLGVLYAWLKIDLATAGRYRARLTCGAVAVVLAVAAMTYGAVLLLQTETTVTTPAAAPYEDSLEPPPDEPAGGTESAVATSAKPPRGNALNSMGRVEYLIVVGACIYALVLTLLSNGRGSWVFGFVACLAAAMFFTPADPLSTLLVAAPLCLLYTIAVLAWRAPRQKPPSF